MTTEARSNNFDSPIRLVGYTTLTILSIAGVWAIAVRLSQGLMVTHMTQHVPWGLWVALYIYFIGLSAGSFLLSTLVYVFNAKRFEAVGPLALVQALGCLGLGMVMILIDLGHPERFLNVLIYWNPTSVLAWECLFYTAYAVILALEIVLALQPAFAKMAAQGGGLHPVYRFLSGNAEGGRLDPLYDQKRKKWLKVLGLVGIPVAIGVHGGTGAIFAVVKSRPTWYTGLFPIVFLVSALVSGGALLTFLAAIIGNVEPRKKLHLIQGLARMTISFLAIDLLLMTSEILVTFYGGIPHHITGWKLTMFGPFWWVFWIFQLGLGALVPILIVALPKTRNSIAWLGLAGALIVVGIVGVRLNIVIPPLIEPQFPTLPEAYHHVRFAVGYFPSGNEWLVGLGSISLGIWVFLLARRFLPLDLALREGLAEQGE